MGLIIIVIIVCWLCDNDKSTSSTNSDRNNKMASASRNRNVASDDLQARIAIEANARRAESVRILARREREYWQQRQREISLHNALVQQNRMTQGASTASRTYWH